MTQQQTTHSGQVGYWELISKNRNFRWLWFGNIVSLFGDWFNTIAIYNLVTQMTGSPLALAWVFISKMLPFAVVSPLTGLITDRFDRRKLMIGVDMMRAVIVLGFLWVKGTDDLVLLYTLTALQVALGAIFIPARSAVIPNVTTPAELLTANTLLAATWSSILAIGAALGGFVATGLGEQSVFIIDSISYVVSSFCIYQTVIPQIKLQAQIGSWVQKLVQTFREIREGWQYMWHHPEIGRIATAKATWAIGGGAMVFMITLVAEQLIPDAPAVGIGIVFAIRGIGTGIGPVLARAWFRDLSVWPLVLGMCVVISGVMYSFIGFVPWELWLVCLIVFLAHTPSGTNWVLSSVLLQQRALDQFRGRVFSTEWLLLTIVEAGAIFMAGFLLDKTFFSLKTGFIIFGLVEMVCGLLWIMFVIPAERKRF